MTNFGAIPSNQDVIASKPKLNATTAPGVSDDSSAGYSIGSVWIDTTADEVYQCTDSTVGAAVWKQLSGTGGGGGGEANTASNVGTAGVGVFKVKSGVDLQFKKINVGSSKLTVTDDTVNNEVDLDIGTLLAADIPTITTAKLSDFNTATDSRFDTRLATKTTDNLSEGATNKYNATHTGDVTGATALTIANDAVTFAKMQNINTARLLGRTTASAGDVEEITVGSGLSLSAGSLTATGGSGEANTASNVGTDGVGVFKVKSGVDLQFKKINAGSVKITITDDTVNNEVDIDVGTINFSDLSTKTHTHADAANGGTLAASVIASGQIALARGGTNADLSATGGTGQVLKQASAGAAITVATLVNADIPTTLDAKSFTGNSDFNAGNIRLPVGTSALTTTEGYAGWQSTTKRLRIYDGQRERIDSEIGWCPYAYPIAFNPANAFTTALALAANGGSIAIPVNVIGHMLLQSVSVRNTDATLQRTWGWDLYEQYLNNGNGAENTLTRVANSTANEVFTAAAASTRTVNAGTLPTYLAPGVYWLVIQCRDATNTFGLGSTAASAAFAVNTAQTKTTTNPNGSTLDLVAVTWTKKTAMYAVRLNGRVFGQTSAF